jgi:hypothetical protein
MICGQLSQRRARTREHLAELQAPSAGVTEGRQMRWIDRMIRIAMSTKYVEPALGSNTARLQSTPLQPFLKHRACYLSFMNKSVEQAN